MIQLLLCVKRGIECEVIGQAGCGCDAMARGRDCEVVGQTGRKVSETIIDRAVLALALILGYI